MSKSYYAECLSDVTWFVKDIEGHYRSLPEETSIFLEQLW